MSLYLKLGLDKGVLWVYTTSMNRKQDRVYPKTKKGFWIERIALPEFDGYGNVQYNVFQPDGSCEDASSTLAGAKELIKMYEGK